MPFEKAKPAARTGPCGARSKVDLLPDRLAGDAMAAREIPAEEECHVASVLEGRELKPR
jgi:hypothetical protein